MNITGIKTKNAQSIFRKKSVYGTYTAHHELKDTLKVKEQLNHAHTVFVVSSIRMDCIKRQFFALVSRIGKLVH